MTMLVDFYNSSNEGERLNLNQALQVEWLTTTKYLERFIPAGARILDCCAGGGQYSFWLAEKGFSVTAGDLMEKHVAEMKEAPKAGLLEDILQCDTRDLSMFGDKSFDAVLCMGAYYHLHLPDHREKAVSECVQVLKPGGILALAYINRYAVFLHHLRQDPRATMAMDKIMEDGRFVDGVFYGSTFNEVPTLCGKLGLREVRNIGIDGFTDVFMDLVNTLSTKEFEKYLDIHFRICEEPSIVGSSMHGLYIARKV